MTLTRRGAMRLAPAGAGLPFIRRAAAQESSGRGADTRFLVRGACVRDGNNA